MFFRQINSQVNLGMNQVLRTSTFFIVNCIVACVAISALLASSALAQVHGPGPSPASDFDTLINLPGDEAVISGQEFETVGGIDGETTQLNVEHDGTIGSRFSALAGSEVNVCDGTVGARFRAEAGSEVNIISGNVDSSFLALNGSQVNISGGNFGDSLEIGIGSEVNISGGNFSDLIADGSLNISGGTFNSLLQASSGSEVAISGGTFTSISVNANSQINIVGRQFLLDGEELDMLVPEEPFTITDRNVPLSGVLDDGQPFNFQLTTPFSIDGFFSSNATVTLTLPLILGDVNRDGVVDFSDISPFIEVLATGSFQAEADIDQNDDVNFSDIAGFIGLLSGNN